MSYTIDKIKLFFFEKKQQGRQRNIEEIRFLAGLMTQYVEKRRGSSRNQLSLECMKKKFKILEAFNRL